jgi:hypothetical protein
MTDYEAPVADVEMWNAAGRTSAKSHAPSCSTSTGDDGDMLKLSEYSLLCGV